MKCKYPESVCGNMTVLNGVAYCDSVPCILKEELPPMTNADRIRAMSDAELAEALQVRSIDSICDIVCTGSCRAYGTLYKSSEEVCKDIILRWLQQPVGEDT